MTGMYHADDEEQGHPHGLDDPALCGTGGGPCRLRGVSMINQWQGSDLRVCLVKDESASEAKHMMMRRPTDEDTTGHATRTCWSLAPNILIMVNGRRVTGGLLSWKAGGGEHQCRRRCARDVACGFVERLHEESR